MVRRVRFKRSRRERRENVYLGKVVRDIGKKGLDQPREVIGILNAIDNDYSNRKIDAKTFNRRTALLGLIVMRSNKFDDSTKAKLLSSINKIRELNGFNPLTIKSKAYRVNNQRRFEEYYKTYIAILNKAQKIAEDVGAEIAHQVIERELERSEKALKADLAKDTKFPKTATQFIKNPNRYDIMKLNEIISKQKSIDAKARLLINKLLSLEQNEKAYQIKKLRARANKLFKEYKHYRILKDLSEIIREEHFDEFMNISYWNALIWMYRNGTIKHPPPELPPNIVNRIKDPNKKKKWIKRYENYMDYLKENYVDLFDGITDKLEGIGYELEHIERQINEIQRTLEE